MLMDSLGGKLIETTNSSAGTMFLALLPNPHRIDRPSCLQNPRPKGGILANEKHPLSISAEPTQFLESFSTYS